MFSANLPYLDSMYRTATYKRGPGLSASYSGAYTEVSCSNPEQLEALQLGGTSWFNKCVGGDSINLTTDRGAGYFRRCVSYQSQVAVHGCDILGLRSMIQRYLEGEARLIYQETQRMRICRRIRRCIPSSTEFGRLPLPLGASNYSRRTLTCHNQLQCRRVSVRNSSRLACP
jgi:hypothetical protein